MQDPRHAAITELANRILTVATKAYESAPKVILNADDPDPPPLSWHTAYTAGQLVEVLLRLCVLRKVEADALRKSFAVLGGATPGVDIPGFEKMLVQVESEANRGMKFFNIELAQEI